ncbi:hypothetical protein T484DRAFT_1851859, partial [Baffinella frigidus]
MSVPGSSTAASCVCDGGFEPTAAGACSVCAAGTWCSAGVKTECLASSSSPVQSNEQTDCVCDPGFSGPAGGLCVACEAGTYNKELAGSCVPFPAGTYCPLVAATSIEEAINCSAHSWSPAGSDSITDCTCDPGYTGADGGTCASCEAGAFKEASGSAACVSSDTCTSCPTNSNSPAGSTEKTDCDCNPGFSGDDLVCVECEAGTYKPERGAAACTLCGGGTYSESIAAVANATCLSCPAKSTSDAGSGSMDACECARGFAGASNTECVACEAGTYQDKRGNTSCIVCNAGTYSGATAASSAAQCTACPADSLSPAGSVIKEACVCNAGFPGFDGMPCTGCVAGKYKSDTGPGVCTPCEAGTYSTRVGSPGVHLCLACPSFSHSGVGSGSIDHCSCLPGYGVAKGAGFVGKVVGHLAGLVKIEQAGDYEFSTTSLDGSRLWVDGVLLVKNGGPFSAGTVSGDVRLSAGFHTVRADWFEVREGATMVAQYSGPDTGGTAEVVSGFHFPEDSNCSSSMTCKATVGGELVVLHPGFKASFIH